MNSIAKPVTRFTESTSASAEEMYLALLKKCLTRSAFPDFGHLHPARGTIKGMLHDSISRVLARRRLVLAKLPQDDLEQPNAQTSGETMMGIHRLNNLHECMLQVLQGNVPGDFIETGVWRGGAVIFMRAVLAVYAETSRTVWAADSFAGVPRPNPERYPYDAGDSLWKHDYLAVSLDEVKTNIRRYGLLDDQVQFLVGWFRDTLPTAPIQSLAVLRLDGDIYESTLDALRHLYPKVSSGGFVIVDDYGAIPSCKAAVDEYRSTHGIIEPFTLVNDRQQSCIYWRKP